MLCLSWQIWGTTPVGYWQIRFTGTEKISVIAKSGESGCQVRLWADQRRILSVIRHRITGMSVNG